MCFRKGFVDEVDSFFGQVVLDGLDRLIDVEKARKGDEYDRIALRLADLLLLEWDEKTRKAINYVIRRIAQGKKKAISKEELDQLLAILARRLGISFAGGLEAGIADRIEETYGFAQNTITGAAVPTFNIIDTQAMDWLAKNSLYWIGNHYRADLSKRINTLATEVLKKRLTRDEATKFFSENLGETFKKSNSYWKLMANHVVTRGREFGHAQAYADAGIEFIKIKIIDDKRTSNICLGLKDKVFPVSRMIETRNRIMAAKTPEAAKKVAPWVDFKKINGKKAGKLPAYFTMPPYHGNCRTRTIRATAAEAKGWADKVVRVD